MRIGARKALLLAVLVLDPAAAAAQGRCPERRSPWPAVLAAAAVATAAVVDARVDARYVAHRTRTLDRVAGAGNAIGAGRAVEPALGAVLLSSLLLRRPSLTREAATVTIAYAVGNGLVGVLKPVVGRHRPAGAGSPWDFHPFSASGADHSWPSSHMIHVTTVAAASASLSDSPVVDAAAMAAVGLVGWSRVYSHQHWTSDVVSTAILGTLVARATVHWARRRGVLPAGIRCIPDGARGGSSAY